MFAALTLALLLTLGACTVIPKETAPHKAQTPVSLDLTSTQRAPGAMVHWRAVRIQKYGVLRKSDIALHAPSNELTSVVERPWRQKPKSTTSYPKCVSLESIGYKGNRCYAWCYAYNDCEGPMKPGCQKWTNESNCAAVTR